MPKIEINLKFFFDPFFQVFMAISDGKHRKPCTGMWNELEKKNGDLEIDKNASIFVGDAAGRIKTDVGYKFDT